MLRGEKVGLRARTEADTEVLHAELAEDVQAWSRSEERPWRPLPLSKSPFVLGEPNERNDAFSVVELAGDQLAGVAVLWGIDTHNRTAHLGLSLRPSFQGRGLGVDTVRTLNHYGFAVRGLRRLQLETLADNVAMRKAAERAGFTLEGTLRQSAYVVGELIDVVIYGQLATEWEANG